MKKYLVVYSVQSGIAQLENVGVFEGIDAEEAELKAMQQWDTTARLYSTEVESVPDGWSYYV